MINGLLEEDLIKMRMKFYALSGALAIALAITANISSFSQCKEWKWPEDPGLKAKTEEKKVLYEDALKNKNYKQAQAPLVWLLKNTPQLNTSIYINGAEIFDALATAEKDPIRKQVYVDSLLIIYDLRIANCGDAANVLNRKGLSSFKYNINNSEKATEILALLDSVFALNGENVMDGTLIPYMQAVRVNKLKLKTLTDEQILQRYDNVMSVIDVKIKKAQSENKPIDKYTKIQEDINDLLSSIITVDCKFVKSYLEPKFNQTPDDVKLAKKIFTFMLQGKCTDDPLWLTAAEVVHKAEPEFGIVKNIAIKYLAQNNFDKAETNFKEALTLAGKPEDKAEVLFYLGSLEVRKGNKVAARELYRQAGTKDAFEKIGDLYYNSAADCAKKENMADDRLVYLVAYDMYQKAGAADKMASAKKQFPSKEEIFLVNYQVGSTIKVGCWINESTTIRTRD
jgi:tetratricopeptide (TPR) repeat protein